MAENEKEIVLGTGKLLGLFFGLVVLCALFLGLGYSWGRKSAQSAPLQLTSADLGESGSGVKPLASSTQQETPANNCPNGNCGGGPTTTAPTSQEAAQTASEPAPAVELGSSATPQPVPENAKPAAKPTSAVKPITPGSGYLVQVAAVTKQEDAEALAAALRQKQYPVFISPGTLTDKYFHVQVGPFPDEKQADAMKAKLLGDGYNAIVKK